MEIGETVHAETRAEWRQWLRKHHRSRREVWLVYHTKASGRRFVAYEDAVEEALCFGWIDSIVKKHGETSRAQRFTPRRPGSKVSELNKARVRKLIRQRKMTRAGLEAIGDIDGKFEIEKDIERALRRDPEVWRNFQALPQHYREVRVGWIQNTRGAPDVRKQRLDHFVKMTKANKKFGSWQ